MQATASEPVAPMASASSTAPVSSCERGPLHQAQHLDELPGAGVPEVGLEAPAQHGEAARQLPALEGPGEVQGAGLSLQEGQVVARVEGDLLFAPVARVGGHHLGADQQADLFDPAHDGHLVVGEGGGHRVVVAVEAHERRASSPWSGRPGAARRSRSGRASMAAWSTARRSALVSGLPRTRRNRSAKQAAARYSFSSANEANDGTGTSKFRLE